MDHARDCWAPLAPDTQSLGRVGCCELRPLAYARGAHADAAMRRFAYHGSDASLLYKYVLSPLAAFLVELLPRWVAPNLITLVGLGVPLSATLIYAHQCPAMDCRAAPRWPHLYCAVAILVYQTLDNMDGKQARRTRTASPLGMFFDHGCDAINCVVCTLSVPGCAITAGRHDVGTMLGLLTTSFTPFFFATWDHYTRGRFELPPVNGPNEGLVCAAILGGCSWWYGVEWWWQSPAWCAVARVQLLWAASLTGQLLTVAGQLWHARRWLRARSGGGASMFAGALLNAMPHLSMLGLAATWIACAPEFARTRPREVLLLCGCAHIEICTTMMHCHMCEVPYSRVHLTMVPLGLAAADAAFGWRLGPGFVRALVAASLAYTLVCGLRATRHAAAVLQVPVLRVRSSIKFDK